MKCYKIYSKILTFIYVVLQLQNNKSYKLLILNRGYLDLKVNSAFSYKDEQV